jgi:bifunctional non-homologous end joining protein LigD
MMIHDAAGLRGLVQMGGVEIHIWGSKAADIGHPERLVFDLDPDPALAWKMVADAARELRRILDNLKLPAFLKTTGGKGLHLVVPVDPSVPWDQARQFCKVVAGELARRDPSLYVTNMRKALRKGKIFIDYLRNGRGATSVAPYSVRAREGAPVSLPLDWEELGRVKSGAQFGVGETLKRIERGRDAWAEFEKARVDIAGAVGAGTNS